MALIFLIVPLIAMLALLVWYVALYALPIMVTITVYQWASSQAFGTGTSLLIAIGAAAVALGFAVFVNAFARNPLLRLGALLLFSAPAAIAGYTLVHGVAKHSLEEGVGLTLLCALGGLIVGAASVAKLNELGTSTHMSLMDHPEPR